MKTIFPVQTLELHQRLWDRLAKAFDRTARRGFVAQVFNLPYRRFSNRRNVRTTPAYDSSESPRIALVPPTGKSAIRQAGKPALLGVRLVRAGDGHALARPAVAYATGGAVSQRIRASQSTRGLLARSRMVVAGILGLLLAVQTADARIGLVTLPGRDTVQLTIYNSADLTLVKETRALTFRQGFNRLEFSWANTLIDPTSVEFRALTHADAVDVLDVSFPPRVTNTLEWRIHSEFAGEVQVEIRYFTSGISWSADYVSEAAKNEK